MANIHMVFVYDMCISLLLPSVLNDGDLSASLKSAGRACCGPMLLQFRLHVPISSLHIILIDGISYVSKIMSTRLLDNAVP